MASKLKPVTYNPKKIPAWKVDDPLPAMMEYAQIILWNVPPSNWHPPAGKVTAQQQLQWWEDLASVKVVKAHRAVWNLMAGATDTVAFLEDHLYPVPTAAQKRLDQLLLDLDNDSFERREAASHELSRGTVAESVLEKTLANHPSLELRRRLEAILKDLPNWPEKNPELLRNLRAIGLLRQIGTPHAKTLLDKLAAGAPSARLTQKAKDAIQPFAQGK